MPKRRGGGVMMLNPGMYRISNSLFKDFKSYSIKYWSVPKGSKSTWRVGGGGGGGIGGISAAQLKELVGRTMDN